MSAPMDAERRLVTVLFADLVGHNDVARRVGAEEWSLLLESYFAEMRRPIDRYGGSLEKFIGDAIFAVFGAPRAHEDDAERAVRASVEMQAALARLNVGVERRLGVPLAMRISLATGEAVAPGEAREDRLVIGELTSLAERLQREAPEAGVILSERTYHLVAPLVEATPAGPFVLRGFPDPQRAYLLDRIAPIEARPLGIGVLAPVFGRDRELAELDRAAERMAAGQGQILFLIGEAGLGKSRLAAELQGRLGAATTFLDARCQEFTQAVSYGVIAQHLRAYLGVAEGDPPEVVRLQLGAALSRVLGSPTSRERPVLERMLGLISPLEVGEHTPALGAEPVRPEIARAITALWDAAARTAPLVLRVEDLHWVDSGSAGVLTELFQVTDHAALMLVCTFRPERRSLAWDLKVAAEREFPHRYQELRLDPLPTEETRRLAAALLEQMGLPADLQDFVARRAEGNPFYVEEVVRSLRQQRTTPADARSLPDTLQGVLQARLDGLPRSTRRIAQTASVIGRTFPLRLLQMVSATNGELTDHLSTLQRTGFVLEQERHPEPRFAFKHILIREAAYHTLLGEERRAVHRRVAEALEQEGLVETSFGLLAYHFAHGEVWEKAFRYEVKAGDAARALSDLEGALDHYASALRIARDYPASVVDQPILVNAQRARGDLLSFLGKYGEAQRHFEGLLEQYHTSKVRAKIYSGLGLLQAFMGNLREAQVSLEEALRLLAEDRDAEEEVSTLQHLATVLERRRDYTRALECAHRGLALAKELAHDGRVREFFPVLTSTHFYGGEIAQALEYADAGLRAAVETDDQLGIVQARNNLAHLLLFTGDLPAALRSAEEAVALATRLNFGVPLVVAYDTLAQIRLEQGRWPAAAEAMDLAEDLVRRLGLAARWQAVVHSGQGFVALAHSRWSDAIQRLELARGLAERGGLARNLPRIYRGLAEAYLGLGSSAQARAHAREVQELERGGNTVETPAALRILGILARDERDLPAALGLLEESRRLLGTRAQSDEHGRVLLELAVTLAAAGRSGEARGAVEDATQIYERLGAEPMLEQARRVAGRLERP